MYWFVNKEIPADCQSLLLHTKTEDNTWFYITGTYLKLYSCSTVPMSGFWCRTSDNSDICNAFFFPYYYHTTNISDSGDFLTCKHKKNILQVLQRSCPEMLHTCCLLSSSDVSTLCAELWEYGGGASLDGCIMAGDDWGGGIVGWV